MPKNTFFLLNSPLKTKTLELVCPFVFAGTALSIISAILFSSSSENLEVEAMLNTAQFLNVIVNNARCHFDVAR